MYRSCTVLKLLFGKIYNNFPEFWNKSLDNCKE